MEDDLTDTESPAERAYTWVIRGLYLTLVAGNLALLWDAWKDTPAGMEARARAGAYWRRLQDCEGCAKRKRWIERQVGHVMWDATQTVEHGPDWDAEEKSA